MRERDAEQHPSGGGDATAVDGKSGKDQDASIHLSVAELEGDLAIALDGEGPSAEEQHRAHAFVRYLRGIAPRLTHASDAAIVHVELAEHLGTTLGDAESALEACRTAFRKRARDLPVARAYRRAALRARAPREVSTALDAEAKRTTAGADRAALHAERAMLLAKHFDNENAARYAYKHALDAEPTNVLALMANETALVAEEDHAGAAEVAQKLAAASSDPKLRAEHLARAARLLERAGDAKGALALAASARLDAPDSPAVIFALERLCLAEEAYGMFVSLRENQIKDGLIDEASGWFDIGIIAAYALVDDERAVQAFEKAKALSGDEAACCLEELAWLYLRMGDYARTSDAIADQLPMEELPRGRAALWHRLARIRGEHLDDEEGTIVALDAALAEAPSYYPALADAGRLFHRSGSRERLIKMHRLEAEAASTDRERGGALRRLGELLIEEQDTRDDGIDALREALRITPGHLSAFVALERAFVANEAWSELVELYQGELTHTKEPARRAHLYARIGEVADDHLGDKDLALESLREAMKVDASSGPPQRLVQLADLLADGDDLDELVSVLTQLAEQTSDRSARASVYQRLARVHERRERPDDAAVAYKKAVQIAPPSHPAHGAAGRAFLRGERYRDLLEVLEAGLAASPPKEKPMWLQKIAAVQERHLGRIDDAVVSLEKALALAPDAQPVRQMLIEVLTRNQRYAELHRALAGVTEGGARIALRRGVVAEAAGDMAAALEHYGRAVEAGSKLARVPLLRAAAQVGRWDALERHYGGSHEPQSMLHERCRAAEIAYERLQRSSDAVRYLTEALSSNARAMSPVVSMLPLVTGVPDTQVRLLDVLMRTTSDAATQLAASRMAAHAWVACGEPEKALEAHRRVLAQRPADPVSLVAAEIELEHIGDRVALADVLGAAARDGALEPQLAAMINNALGNVLEQLGQLRDAAEALERARVLAGQDVSRQVLIALHRIYVQLEDDERVPEILETLARCPPAGATQAACYRRLAAWHWEHGHAEAAATALRAALNAEPCDYRAINVLAELPNVQETEILDLLMRAFELEKDETVLVTLGTTLASRLLLLGRWHTARETIDRVLAVAPDSLPALMLLAETHERRKSWELAAAALDRIGDHQDASPRVKLEALRRLANLQVLHLQRHEEAVGTAERVAALSISDELALRAKLEIDILIRNDEAAAKTLDSLTKDFDDSDQRRVDDLLRLATLLDASLDDPHRAIDALTRISRTVGHALAVPGLRLLGEKTQNWEGVREALEDALTDDMHPQWECAVRRRLARVLREHLGCAQDAVAHEARILELDPSEGPTGERAAARVVTDEPDDAIARHRRAVRDAPHDVAAYRELRNLFLAEDDRDGAFCAEALLVGLGVASDEEEYFYRQRRAKHAGKMKGVLSPVELALLCPEREDFVARLARVVDGLVPRIFPVDADGYGIMEDVPSDAERALMELATDTAQLFSVPEPRVHHVSPRLGPCSEVEDEQLLLLLPRGLEDAPPREQRFVCGALLARSALGAALTDPRRLNAFTDRQLDHLIAAALAIGDPEHEPHDASVVYLDMRERLSGALGHLSLRRLEGIAKERPAQLGEALGGALRSAMNRAAARAAILCAGDPAVAIASAITYAGMFEAGALPERRGASPPLEKLPPDFLNVIGFAVSDTHAKLRNRLFEAGEDG